jgi:hypothetical protein
MPTTKTKGCGCGGGCGGKPAPSPEAASAPCSGCETAAFVRPRFFAGQLLTDDDLGALLDYTVAKQRFHNARLFGAGVVCGLGVECGPCDSTQIVIEPGYALDCCGNDLVLTCQRTLDLAPMVRDLQARQKGRSDCTDPCPPPAPGQQPPSEAATAKQYCLYLHYTERSDQPVAAYPVGDDCDAARCEPTRILEGVRFELRCPPPALRGASLQSALEDCQKQLDPGQELERLALSAARIGGQRPVTAPAGDPYRELRSLQPDLLEEAISDKPLAERFELRLQMFSTLVPLLSRAKPEKSELRNQDAWVEYTNQLATGFAVAQDNAAGTALDRMYAQKLAEQWQAPRDSSKGARAASDGVLWDKELSRASAQHLKLTASKLEQIGGCFGKVIADCELRDLIERLEPKWNLDDDEERDKASQQLSEAAEIVRRVLADCACAALNPPCPPCDDLGVLLACFEVEQCKVVRICNSVRQYVLAPANLRYWGGAPEFSGCCTKPEASSEQPPASEDPGSGWFRPPPAPSAPAAAVRRLDAMRRRAPLFERLGLESAARDRSAALQDEIAELRRRLDGQERRLKERK